MAYRDGAGRNLDLRGEARSIAYALHYGSTQRPLATVVPDLLWPGMWRIASPDGRLSDMANLTRAKDAAEAIAERGPPARNRKLFRWHMGCVEEPRTASYSDSTAPDVLCIAQGPSDGGAP